MNQEEDPVETELAYFQNENGEVWPVGLGKVFKLDPKFDNISGSSELEDEVIYAFYNKKFLEVSSIETNIH